MILQVNVANLRADLDAIIDMRVPELETSLPELIEDTILVALFTPLLHGCPCHYMCQEALFKRV